MACFEGYEGSNLMKCNFQAVFRDRGFSVAYISEGLMCYGVVFAF